jgi:hypothetical protein
MIVPAVSEWQLSPTPKDPIRLRVLAAECWGLARIINYRPDRERMVEMARRYDEEAARIEAEASSGMASSIQSPETS